MKCQILREYNKRLISNEMHVYYGPLHDNAIYVRLRESFDVYIKNMINVIIDWLEDHSYAATERIHVYKDV